MKLKKSTADLLLIVVTLLWGSGFVATKIAIDNNAPTGMINLIRGGIFALLCYVFYFKKINSITKEEIKKGFVAGSLNSLAYVLQTVSLHYTTVSNSAFLTASNVLIVPFIVWIFHNKRPTLKVFVSVAVCLSGMAALTGFLSSSVTLNWGDALALLGAIMFAFSLTYISNNAKDIDFSIIAFMLGLTQAIGGLFYFIVFDGGEVGGINWTGALLPLLYMGVFPSFVSQTLQVVAQQNTTATSAALIMTLEAVFGSVFSILFGYEKLTWSLAAGGGLILLSIIISEINIRKKDILIK
jgi:drug/metabolite transporter (DMT)-like permease